MTTAPVVVRRAEDLRAEIGGHRAAELSIGFVATMGALHEGHLSLFRMARSECDLAVISIFVNPAQFGPSEDLTTYPRDEERDLRLAAREGIDVAFVPSVEVMYPRGVSTTVSVPGLSDVLEGEARPGHFDGVATVVTKLLSLIAPDRAYFGQKDAQQVAVIKRLVADLFLDVTIVVGPTIREADGLAMSSRNAYLSPDERGRATALYRALLAGRAALEAELEIESVEEAMRSILAAEDGIGVDYARAVDPETFGVPRAGREVLLAVAARVGSTRLIDNMVVGSASNEGAEHAVDD